MTYALLIVGVGLPLLMGAIVLVGLHLRRRHHLADDLSPVTRQHIHLFQGGQLSESAVESAKARLQSLLERGEVEAVEASIRPGMQYVVQVRALAEIGTDEAGRILERQLLRRLSDDQIEQSWYWIDLASCLRSLNRDQSLPHLLRCAAGADVVPLGHFFAAETVCFLGFSGYVRQASSPLRRAALRVLHLALEGLRFGVQPQMFTEARLGETIEALWDDRPTAIDSLSVRVFVEALRQIRRAHHAEAILADDPADQEAYRWQISRLIALEPELTAFLKEAIDPLLASLPKSSGDEQRDILSALNDLRTEAGAVVLPLLADPDFEHADDAIRLLTWSKEQRVARWLRTWTAQNVAMDLRAVRRHLWSAPRRPTLGGPVPYEGVLRALRGHPSPETESFLLVAARDFDPTFRAAAVSSLGWWEPIRRVEVLHALQQARRDLNPEVRRAARAALARLGELVSLQRFRHNLHSDDTQRVHETIQLIATENLTLLWPDLDGLAESDDPEIAYHAREALARLAEEVESSRL